MSPRLALAAALCAVAVSATACGSAGPPRSPEEIAAEQSFLGSDPPAVVVPTSPSTSAPVTTTTPAAAPVTMVVVGDAYTTGTSMGGLGTKNWSALVAAHFGWTNVPLAAAGSGYLVRGSGPGTFVERVPEVVARKPQVVIVWGARNDVGSSTSAISAAVRSMLTQLKAGLPSAQLVVMGPSWTDKTPPSAYRPTDEAEKAAAAALGVAFIDDLSEDWLDAKGLVDPDGIHPTDAGQAAIASNVIRDLTTLGVPAKAAAAAG